MVARPKRRIRPKFFLLLAAFIVILGGGIYLLVTVVRDGEMALDTFRLEYKAQTVLLRDEQVVSSERFEKANYHVAEGAAVQDGDAIAEVFKWGYQDDSMNTLLEKQKEIYQYQLSQLEDIIRTDLDELQESIRQKALEVRAIMDGDSSKDLLQAEHELKDLLAQRTALLRELVQPDETLTSLYQEESVQINNLSSWKSDWVNNVGSGIVSFYFDGNEQALDTTKLEMLNADLISRILNGGGAASSNEATTSTPLYRLIDSNHFYLAFLTDTSSPFRLVAGESYTVVFDGYQEVAYTGVARSPVIGEKQVVNMIEFQQEMGNLMGARVLQATILKDITGMRVPVSALDMRENTPGILRVSGDDTQWIQVDVLALDGSDAIIRAARAEQELTSNDRYKKPS